MIAGYIRTSSLASDASPIIQGQEITAYCEKEGLGAPTLLAEDLGTSGVSTKFRQREKGRWLLLNAHQGDTVIAVRLDRLGRNCADILNTVERLQKIGVKIIVLNLLGQTLDLSTVAGKVIVTMFGLAAEIEAQFLRERLDAGKDYWKTQNCADGSVRRCRKYVEVHAGGRRRRKWEWDMEQLEIMAELAHRYAKGQSLLEIQRDFWARGLKDHRGLPWGQSLPKKEIWRPRHPVAQMQAALRWFHRAAQQGILPPPYKDISDLTPKYPQFQLTPRKYNRQPKPAKVDDRSDWTKEQFLEDWKLENDG